ncbi:MAG: substrate-binding domain-containing protein [Pseudomonadota bacterium]
MRRRLLPLLILPLLPFHAARAATLRVLSAGAVEPGLAPAVAKFTQAPVAITYATAPQLRARIQGGEMPDLLVAPVSLIDELLAAGRLLGSPLVLGRVGIGVVVRADAAAPDIHNAASLRRAVEDAERVVFNRASTGLAMERIFAAWGIAPRAVRFATGAEVLQRVLAGSGREIGFAAITEIRMLPGLRYIGPVPPEIQIYTTYAAAPTPGAGPEAEALLRHLAGADSRSLLDAAGVEAAG